MREVRLLGVAAVLFAGIATTAAAQEEGSGENAEWAVEGGPSEASPANDANTGAHPDPVLAQEPDFAQTAERAMSTIPVTPLDPPAEIEPEPEPSAPAHLDEVVVTATRRQQSINEVPVAVTEVDGNRIEAGTIRDTRSLTMEVPSLNISVSGSEISGANIRIRGIGTAGSNGGFESSVGVFVDGIYVPRPGLALNDLVDVERIEVLRGPQGTLFGKNTTVGAINILTRKPERYPEARVTATFGAYGARIFQGVVGGPVFDDAVALRLSAQYNRQDGYIHNLYDGEDYNDRDRYVVRGQALFEPTPASTLRLIVDHISKDEHCCATPYTFNGETPSQQIEAQGGTVFEPPAEYTVAFDRETFSRADETGVSAQLQWDFDGAQMRATAGHRQGEAQEASDGDKNDLDIARIPLTSSLARLTTAELSFHGDLGWVDWLVGAFYSKEHIRLQQSVLFGEDAGEFIGGTVTGSTEAAALLGLVFGQLYGADTGQTLTSAQQDGTSWSLFAHNVFQLGAGFDATLGARYLRETKEGGGYTESNSTSCNIPAGITLPNGVSTSSLRLLCAAPLYEERFEDSRVTGTAALGKHFDNGSYLYLSASSGFKAGGVNLNPPGTARYSATGVESINTTFEPEEILAYEFGAKLPLGRRVMLSTALFYMDIEDFQISVYDGISFVIGTGNVESKGVEFESRFIVTDWLRVRAAATWANSEYAEGTANAALVGEQLTNSPEWVGQLGADLRAPLGFWNTDVFANVVGRYQSEVNTGADLDANKVQPGFALVNGRVGLAFPRQFEVSLWGTNLTDQFYNSVIFNAPAQSGSYAGSVGMPRTFGIDIRKSF